MNKTDLVKVVAEKNAITLKDANLIVSSVVDEIVSALESGEKVQLTGLGTLSVKTRAARKGMNPQTKKAITIPSSKFVSFSVSSTLKESVNK